MPPPPLLVDLLTIPPEYRKAAPKTPRLISNARRRLAPGERFGKANAINARMPPSPLLVARSTMAKYFSETISSSDQKISDRMPRTLSWGGGKGGDRENPPRGA